METFLSLLAEHWWLALCVAVAGFSVVAQITPNQVDNRILFYLLKLVDILALNFRKPTILSKTEGGDVRVDFDKYKAGFINPPVVGLLALLALLVVLCSGCALKNLPPEDQALAVTDEITTAYMSVRAEYLDLSTELPPDKVAWMVEHVAPILDEGRDALVLAREAAATWKAYKVKPDNFEGLVDRVRRLVSDAWAKIAEITGREV